MIDDLLFADAVFECEISKKKCFRNGKCSDCLIATYFMFFDDDKFNKVMDEVIK